MEKAGSRVLNSNTVPEDRRVTSLLRSEHRKVVEYVNQVIGTSVVAMSTADAPWKDEPIIDLINQVQAETVRAALAGGEFAALPVLSQASCFSRTAGIPAGEVTIKDAAGLYPFENTLEARLLTGAQLKDYLEYSARYYVRTAGGWSGGHGEADERGRDSGLQLRRGVGGDVRHRHRAAGGLADRGAVVRGEGDRSGGAVRVGGEQLSGEWWGNFPHVPGARQVWADSDEIRNTIIGWVREKRSVDPAAFASVGWRLTRGGAPVFP